MKKNKGKGLGGESAEDDGKRDRGKKKMCMHTKEIGERRSVEDL